MAARCPIVEEDRQGDENGLEAQERLPESSNILCALWRNDKLGVAYYGLNDYILYIYEEMDDLAPLFMTMRNIYRETSPKYVISMGTVVDEYIMALNEMILTGDESSKTSTNATKSEGVQSMPPNFFLITTKEYPYELCKGILTQLVTSTDVSDDSGAQREVFMHSLVNFDDQMSVYAAGALVKYLDKNWGVFAAEQQELKVIDIHLVNMRNSVIMDWVSFNSLQVFQKLSHESNFIRGDESSDREGLSLFNLFSTHVKSSLGYEAMRSLLIAPTNNKDELDRRMDFIDFAMNPLNKELVERVQDYLKHISDINLIILKIQNNKATQEQWQILYENIYNSIAINDLCFPYRAKSVLLFELDENISSDLIVLEQIIRKILDFSICSQTRRPVIRFGLDEELDARKLHRKDLVKYVTAAAQICARQLPDKVSECSVVYLHEMGHMLAIKEWEEDCDPLELRYLDYKFMFALKGVLHYKTPVCLELDRTFGNINADIIAHENRIVERLASFVLKYKRHIRKPLKILALIDCLISVAKIAQQRNYVRPTFNKRGVHEIELSRHPLIEITSDFQPNDFYSGGDYPLIKILSGPNGSGKSVYLKQIGIIILMTHVGSFVPAKRANIALCHSIHCRVRSSESVTVPLSGFMLDISQVAKTLHIADKSSLIIQDEFGRGTQEEDGKIILEGLLDAFIKMKEKCPHMLISTHFDHLSINDGTNLVEYKKMDHMRSGGDIIFLYKIVDGFSESYTFDVMKEAGLTNDIFERAIEINRCIEANEEIPPNKIFNEAFQTILNIDKFELDQESNSEA